MQVGGRHNSLLPPSMTCPVSLNLLSLGMGLPAACSAPISPEVRPPALVLSFPPGCRGGLPSLSGTTDSVMGFVEFPSHSACTGGMTGGWEDASDHSRHNWAVRHNTMSRQPLNVFLRSRDERLTRWALVRPSSSLMGRPCGLKTPPTPVARRPQATDLSDFEGLGRSSRSAYFKRSPFRASFSSQKPADHKQLLDACPPGGSEEAGQGPPLPLHLGHSTSPCRELLPSVLSTQPFERWASKAGDHFGPPKQTLGRGFQNFQPAKATLLVPWFRQPLSKLLVPDLSIFTRVHSVPPFPRNRTDRPLAPPPPQALGRQPPAASPRPPRTPRSGSGSGTPGSPAPPWSTCCWRRTRSRPGPGPRAATGPSPPQV